MYCNQRPKTSRLKFLDLKRKFRTIVFTGPYKDYKSVQCECYTFMKRVLYNLKLTDYIEVPLPIQYLTYCCLYLYCMLIARANVLYSNDRYDICLNAKGTVQ